MSEKTINRLVAFGVFLVTVGVYLKTLSATVVFWDVGEFCAAARLLQVPHPPGSPLFLFVARIASLIPFREDIAARMHAVSAIGSALGVMYLYLVGSILLKKFHGQTASLADRLIVYGGAAVGAFTLAFSTTYWDNSIEAEVYGIAMFFVSLCLWLTLRWREQADEPRSERYLLLIAYLLGLAMGVHILALLIVIPVLMLIYFRRHEFTPKGFLIFALIALGIFFVIYPGIVQILPGLLDGDIGGFKSDLLPFLPLALIAGAVYAAFRFHRTHQKIAHIAALSFLLLVLGYTTYTQVIIRANVDNLPMKENNPNNLSRLTSYLTREQYGETPIVKGASYNNETGNFEQKLFPRRWSSEPLHEATRIKYSGDADFLWRYQIEHMFIRYILWNFVGAEGDWQDAGVSWKVTGGVPLFIALLGCFWLFRKDWKLGLVLLVMFIIMGVVLDLYQNQQDPQPRERDYFYVGAYYVCCLWIAFGVAGLLGTVKKTLSSPRTSLMTVIVCLLVLAIVVPVNLLRANWRGHDRSKLTLAWDYSYNLLQSVEKDGILFTNGDNDTFPLWYLQDVEGIRTDVRIVCLSLVNIPWYVHLLKDGMPHGAKKVPISLTDAEIDRLELSRWDPHTMSMAVPPAVAQRFGTTDSSILKTGRLTWEMKGLPYRDNIRYVRIQDIMVHDILTTNKWDRPIFFSTTSAPDARIGLDAYMWMEGLAFHFKPVRAGGTSPIDIPMMKKNFLAENVLPSQGYQTGYLFRNTNDATVALDENEQRMLMNYRVGFMRIADYFMRTGDDKQEAKRVLQKMEEKLPLAVVPTQQWSYTNYVAKLFYELGDREHFQQYATVVEGKCLELINAGLVVSTDPSSNPYVVLAELYGMRKEYEKGIGMLRKLATQYPNTPWINGQIRQYEELLRGSVSVDSAR